MSAQQLDDILERPPWEYVALLYAEVRRLQHLVDHLTRQLAASRDVTDRWRGINT